MDLWLGSSIPQNIRIFCFLGFANSPLKNKKNFFCGKNERVL